MVPNLLFQTLPTIVLLTLLFFTLLHPAASASPPPPVPVPPPTTAIQCLNDPTDATTINQAAQSCQPGHAVLVHGYCLLTATIVLPKRCDFLGNSRTGTLFKQANHTNLLALIATSSWNHSQPWTSLPVRIAHFGVDGNAMYNNHSGNINQTMLVPALVVIEAWNSVVEDLHLYNSPGDGVRITSVGRDGTTTLHTSQVNSVFNNLFVENSFRHGVYVQDPKNAVTDSNLMNSWVSTSGGSGVYMENGAGWQIRNNHLYGNHQHGIYINRCYATSVVDNYVEDFGLEVGQGAVSSLFSWYYGIACVPQGETGSVVAGNKVFQLRGLTSTATTAAPSFAYIGIPYTHGVGQMNVVNNIVRGVNNSGTIGLRYCGGSGQQLMVLSSGNNVFDVGIARAVDNKTVLVHGY